MSKQIIIETEKMDVAGYLKAIAKEDYLALKTAGHMEIGEDSQGGFLCPVQYLDDIYGYKCEESIVRPRAITSGMISDTQRGPKTVETDRSSGVMFGGISYAWVKEREDLEVKKSKPKLGQLELTAHKLIATFWVTNELIEDSINFTKFIKNTFSRGMAFIQDDAFVNASGVGSIMGILNSNALIPVPRQIANQVNMMDLARMARRLTPESWQSKSAVWMINQNVISEIFEINAAGGNPAATILLNDRKLFGLPVFVSSTCPSLGTLGDVILVDWSYYLIADRELRIAASQHQDVSSAGWKTDETLFRLVARLDAQPIVDAPILPRRGSRTVSPFIALTNPAS